MKLYIKEEFWADLYKRLDHCEREVYLQFMTFEGDKTGLELSSRLINLSHKGIKVRVLIDCFTDYYVSDTVATNPRVFKEVIDTKKMIYDMRKAGIIVKRTRPFGLFGRNFLARNHKKIVLIDDYAYLGGMNISDHNRSWFDFMIGIEDKNKIETIKRDFNFTFSGFEMDFSENDIYTTKNLEKLYLKLVSEAKEEIIISSPFILDLSLLNRLKKKKDIPKKIYTVKNNNNEHWAKMVPYLLHNIQKYKTDVYFYKNFSHAKFFMVDRKYLLIGSSNFGKESFLFMQEIGLLIKDKEFIKDFYKRVIDNSEVEKSKLVTSKFMSKIITHMTYFLMLYYSKIIARRPKVLKREFIFYEQGD